MSRFNEQNAAIDEWWWCRSEALANIGSSLKTSYVAVVDNFLPPTELNSLRTEVSAAYASGQLSQHGLTGGGPDAHEGLLDESIRGDLFGFFEGKSASDDLAIKAGWGEGKAISRTLDKMNTLVCELRDGQDPNSNTASTFVPELMAVSSRSRAMVTCYPGMQRGYTKHCDNAVGNGRKLTTILYLNPDWQLGNGGELVIYPRHGDIELIKSTYGAGNHMRQGATSATVRVIPASVNTSTDNDKHSGATSGSAIAIAPILNRLVLFWSDMRCPHEVLPTNKERFALTLWFVDAAERALSAEKRRLQQEEQSKITQQVNLPSSAAATDATVPTVVASTTKPAAAVSSLSTVQPYLISAAGASTGTTFGVWDSQKNVIVYQVKFANPSAVATTAVDIVEHNTLRVHCTEHSYNQLSVLIVLPPHYKLDEQSTTAKYSKKKEILSISIQCIHDAS